MRPSVAALAAGVWLAVRVVAGPAPLPALTLMSYNVENLFDDVKNGTEYREFVPRDGAWNTEGFLHHVRALSEVVRKAVPGGPDVLLLQEVENENALQTFLTQGLRGMGYQWHVLVPKMRLSANVAIVSRIPVRRVRTHAVGPWKNGAPVRDILEAQVELRGRLLYVFNNHWKSRTEGARATEPLRREAAGVLAARIGEILAAEPLADIVAAGDFNESADEYARRGHRAVTALMPGDSALPPREPAVIFLSSAAPAAGVNGGRCVLYEPWFELPAQQRGSAAWQGEWLTSDHVLLSAGLFDSEGFRYRAGSFTAVRLPFLLTERGFPRRWQPRAADGYSDHLPVLVTLDGP